MTDLRNPFPALPQPPDLAAEDITDLGSVTLRGDIRSFAWDGGSDLSDGADTDATAGFFLDSSAGVIQAQEIIAEGGTFASVTILLNSGTAFPASPSDGELFYRTDLNKSYRFDGTDWHAIDALDDANRVGTAVIPTAAIQDAAITNAKINDLSADKIDVGTLDADRISARSLAVSKLQIGSVDNLIQNPGAEDNTLDPHDGITFAQGGTWAVGPLGRSGAKAFNYDSTGQTAEARLVLNGPAHDRNSHPSVGEGDTVYFEGWVEFAGTGPANRARLALEWRDETGTILASDTSASLTLTATPQKITVEGSAPAGSAYVSMSARVVNDGNTPTGGHRFDDFYARRKVGTLIIEDLAVDIERMLDPIDAARARTDSNNNTLDTTWRIQDQTAVSVPSWVGEAIITQWMRLQVSSSADVNLAINVTNNNSAPASGRDSSLHSGKIHADGEVDVAIVAAPGSSITAYGWAKVASGSENSNQVEVEILGVFKR